MSTSNGFGCRLGQSVGSIGGMLAFRGARAVTRAVGRQGRGGLHHHRRSVAAVQVVVAQPFEPAAPPQTLSALATVSCLCADGGAGGSVPFLALVPRAPQGR